MLLAGDIGGTKSDLAIYSPERGPRDPLVEAVLPSAAYPSLEALIAAFLAKARLPVERLCLGVAGPVLDGRVTVTNLPWMIDSSVLQRTLGLEQVRLLNDLEAIAYGLPLLGPSDLYTLVQGTPEPHGNLAVIAPGTGLGAAFLTWGDGRYVVHASEGGHMDFAPTTPEQIELLRFLMERYDHVSYERICSGLGLPSVYAMHRDVLGLEEPAWLADALANANDATPHIVRAALDNDRPCPLARASLRVFLQVLGAQAGNLVLTLLATGGVYIAGGILPRILPLLEDGALVTSFRSKGRLSHLLERVPLHIVLNPQVARLGAASRVLGD
ncbi:MAG: glucokinase [Anaerolineae bacterium]